MLWRQLRAPNPCARLTRACSRWAAGYNVKMPLPSEVPPEIEPPPDMFAEDAEEIKNEDNLAEGE